MRPCRYCLRKILPPRSRQTDICLKCHNRNVYLKQTYSINIETYEKIRGVQGDRCAICGKRYLLKKYRVDHDHQTRRVRGLLCSKCNRGLGYFGDNVQGLKTAYEYLLNPPAQTIL